MLKWSMNPLKHISSLEKKKQDVMSSLSFWTDPASILIFLFTTFECLDILLKLHLYNGGKGGVGSIDYDDKDMENTCNSVYVYTKQ